MEKDFYLDQRWLAGYMEKDWSDHILRGPDGSAMVFEYPKFGQDLLYSPYHQEFAELIGTNIKRTAGAPVSMLEIGSSLGRTFFEVCSRISSLQTATLVEPSELLASYFSKLFSNDAKFVVPFLKGNKELQELEFDPQNIQRACQDVHFKSVNAEFKDLKFSKPFDLVICSNVIDQCHDPLELVRILKESTSQGGFLAISCTYQWNDKYIEPSQQNMTNISELFRSDFKLIGEKDIEFKVRRSERHWMTFLSQAIVFQKN